MLDDGCEVVFGLLEQIERPMFDDSHVGWALPGAQARDVVVTTSSTHGKTREGGFAGVASVREQPADIVADMVCACFDPVMPPPPRTLHN